MLRSIIVAISLLAVGACSRSHPKTPPGPSAAAVAEANQIFATRCTPCHGATGHGDGQASATLNPHPRNFTDKTWQASVTDEHIQKIVQYGGAAVGKSPNMPANPDLQSKPDVVAALAQKVRGFGK